MQVHDTIRRRQDGEYNSLIQELLVDGAQLQAYCRSLCPCLLSLRLEYVALEKLGCS